MTETLDQLVGQLGPDGNLSIGEVSRQLGVTIDALRYYEAEGLIESVDRDLGGRRRYGRRAIYAVAVVHAMREAGFAIADVRDLVAIKRPESGRDQRLADARRVLDGLAARLDERAAAIDTARGLLQEWRGEIDDAAGSVNG